MEKINTNTKWKKTNKLKLEAHQQWVSALPNIKYETKIIELQKLEDILKHTSYSQGICRLGGKAVTGISLK